MDCICIRSVRLALQYCPCSCTLEHMKHLMIQEVLCLIDVSASITAMLEILYTKIVLEKSKDCFIKRQSISSDKKTLLSSAKVITAYMESTGDPKLRDEYGISCT